MKRREKVRPVFVSSLKKLSDTEISKPMMWQQIVAYAQSMRTTAAERSTIALGLQAWRRIKKASNRQQTSYHDWQAVSDALEIIEAQAAELAGGKQSGGAYARLVQQSIKQNGFAGIASSVRSKLREIRRNQPIIDQWRNSLPPETKARMNNPATIIQHWKASWDHTEPTP